jgi:hypothetical protein
VSDPSDIDVWAIASVRGIRPEGGKLLSHRCIGPNRLFIEAFVPFKEAVEKSLNRGEGKSFGLTQGWAMLIGAVGLLSGILTIFYNLTKH